MEQAKIRHLEGKYKTVSSRLVFLCDDAELRLYLFLKFHAIEKNSCFPSVTNMTAVLTGWSRAKVFRTLKRMKDAGRLKVESGGGRLANVYDIIWYDLENEKGFLHDPSTTGLKMRRQRSQNETGAVSKRDTNYKECNNKELNNKRRRVDKSFESIGAVLRRRQ